MNELANQIAAELEFAIAGPVDWLLGIDLAEQISDRITSRGRLLAEQLAAKDDPHRAETVIDLMAAIWRGSSPPVEWWATPLGRAIAAEVDLAVTQADAAVIITALGEPITRAGVATAIARGTLATDDGKVTVAAAAAFAANRPGRGRPPITWEDSTIADGTDSILDRPKRKQSNNYGRREEPAKTRKSPLGPSPGRGDSSGWDGLVAQPG